MVRPTPTALLFSLLSLTRVIIIEHELRRALILEQQQQHVFHAGEHRANPLSFSVD